jgi:hypothetical protein
MTRDGDAMGIATDVIEDLLGPGKGRALAKKTYSSRNGSRYRLLPAKVPGPQEQEKVSSITGAEAARRTPSGASLFHSGDAHAAVQDLRGGALGRVIGDHF